MVPREMALGRASSPSWATTVMVSGEIVTSTSSRAAPPPSMISTVSGRETTCRTGTVTSTDSALAVTFFRLAGVPSGPMNTTLDCSTMVSRTSFPPTVARA